MPSGKPDKGAALLADLAARPPPDLICLIITGKLDKKAGDAAWVQAIEKHGVWVTIRPVDAAALPGWLRARAKMLRIEHRRGRRATDRRSRRGQFAGRAAKSSKNLSCWQTAIRSARIWCCARSATAHATMCSNWRRPPPPAMRRAPCGCCLGLKSEGVEPTLILWALVRELRGMWQARERDRLRSPMRGSGWNLAAQPVGARAVPDAEAAVGAPAAARPAKPTASSRGCPPAMRGARSPASPARSPALCKPARIQAG